MVIVKIVFWDFSRNTHFRIREAQEIVFTKVLNAALKLKLLDPSTKLATKVSTRPYKMHEKELW